MKVDILTVLVAETEPEAKILAELFNQLYRPSKMLTKVWKLTPLGVKR